MKVNMPNSLRPDLLGKITKIGWVSGSPTTRKNYQHARGGLGHSRRSGRPRRRGNRQPTGGGSRNPPLSGNQARHAPRQALLTKMFTSANIAVYDRGMKNAHCRPHGHHADCRVFRNNEVNIGHVGDCRTCLVHQRRASSAHHRSQLCRMQVKIGLSRPRKRQPGMRRAHSQRGQGTDGPSRLSYQSTRSRRHLRAMLRWPYTCSPIRNLGNRHARRSRRGLQQLIELAEHARHRRQSIRAGHRSRDVDTGSLLSRPAGLRRTGRSQ